MRARCRSPPSNRWTDPPAFLYLLVPPAALSLQYCKTWAVSALLTSHLQFLEPQTHILHSPAESPRVRGLSLQGSCYSWREQAEDSSPPSHSSQTRIAQGTQNVGAQELYTAPKGPSPSPLMPSQMVPGSLLAFSGWWCTLNKWFPSTGNSNSKISYYVVAAAHSKFHVMQSLFFPYMLPYLSWKPYATFVGTDPAWQDLSRPTQHHFLITWKIQASPPSFDISILPPSRCRTC